MEEAVRNFFADYGLLALFILMVADNVGVPLPSEIPLLLAGVQVSQGDTTYPAAVVVAALGSLVGSLVAYWIGKTVGRTVAVRFGRLVLVTPEDIDRAERWFERRGDAAVLLCRMVPLARTIVSIPAGMLKMPLGRFSVLTLIGSTAWCLAVIGAGWALGNSYEKVLGGFSVVGLIVASLALMLAVGWFVARRSRRAARARQDAAARSDG